MIRKEGFVVIKSPHQRGVYKKDIAAELGVHPKTVMRALIAGQITGYIGRGKMQETPRACLVY